MNYRDEIIRMVCEIPSERHLEKIYCYVTVIFVIVARRKRRYGKNTNKSEYTNLPTEIIHDLAAELRVHNEALIEIQRMADSLSNRIKAEHENMESCLNKLS